MIKRSQADTEARERIFAKAKKAFRPSPPVGDQGGASSQNHDEDGASDTAERDNGISPADALSAKLQALVQAANDGKPSSLQPLREFLDEHQEIERHVGDVARHAEAAWLTLVASGDPLVLETAKRQHAAMKAELAGEHATPLERMLVDHVGVAYLAQQHFAIAEATISGGSIQQATLRYKRAESAQKRYLAAVKTLTTLRARVPGGLAPLRGLKLHDPERKLA